MGFLDLLGPVLKTVGKALGIGGKVQEVMDALNTAPPEVRAAIARDLQSHEQALKALSIEEMRVAMSESLAMVQSTDKYVARARPTGLYIYYAASLFLTVKMALAGMTEPTLYFTVLGPLAGVGGLYVYKRTQEKMNGGNGD